MRKVILALAGDPLDGVRRFYDRPVEILLVRGDSGGETAGRREPKTPRPNGKIREFILGISGESLREGIEFKFDPAIEDGVSGSRRQRRPAVGPERGHDLWSSSCGTCCRVIGSIFEGKHDADTLELWSTIMAASHLLYPSRQSSRLAAFRGGRPLTDQRDPAHGAAAHATS